MEQNQPPADGRHLKGGAGEEGHQPAPEPNQTRHRRKSKFLWPLFKGLLRRARQRRIHSRKSRFLWLLVKTVLVVALLATIPFILWGTRYVTQQLKGMWTLFGEPQIFLWHLAAYIGIGVGPWLLHRYGKGREKERERGFKMLTFILVVVVIVVNTWTVASRARSFVTQRAKEMCDETSTSVWSQLNEPSRSTSDIVILDQGISKLMSYIHLIVRNDYPEFDLRTASLHMVPTGVHEAEVWNVIQEGAQRKDGEFLGYPDPDPKHTSLVGKTIKERKTKYCPDITRPEQAADCEGFQPSPSADPPFKSLVCFPLQTGYSSEVFASVCFDSKMSHAFDNKINLMKEDIEKPMNELTTLLQRYRKQNNLIFQDSQPAARPPDAALHP
jgi:hypothetical protein